MIKGKSILPTSGCAFLKQMPLILWIIFDFKLRNVMTWILHDGYFEQNSLLRRKERTLNVCFSSTGTGALRTETAWNCVVQLLLVKE